MSVLSVTKRHCVRPAALRGVARDAVFPYAARSRSPLLPMNRSLLIFNTGAVISRSATALI
jgi:hypothetical protein